MKIHLKILLFFLIPLAGFSQNLYFPPVDSDEWDTISPASLSYCTERIDSLYTYLEQNNSKAFILIKDGKIVLEKYFGEFTNDSVWYWASAGKTLTAALIGIVAEQNYLSINDTSSKFLGSGWTNCTTEQEEKITIRHQLCMTSGLDDGLANPDCTDDSCLQFLAEAGTRWAYHNAPYTLLTDIIETASGLTINQFNYLKMSSKTGINGAFIQTDDNVVFYSKARSMARFGLLLLAGGNWDTLPIIADTTYFNQMTHSSQNINLSYGYLTWLNGQESFMLPQTQFVFPGSLNPEAPDDVFMAVGKNAQLINIAPSKNLVWIRMGNQPEGEAGAISPVFNNSVWSYINALECSPEIISEAGDLPEVIFSPLPLTQVLHIKSTENICKIKIFTVYGQNMIDLQTVGNSIDVPAERFPSGILLLKIYFENGKTLSKILVKN
jgi:CubicO group peptidase (beta-lactamase class C family)